MRVSVHPVAKARVPQQRQVTSGIAIGIAAFASFGLGRLPCQQAAHFFLAVAIGPSESPGQALGAIHFQLGGQAGREPHGIGPGLQVQGRGRADQDAAVALLLVPAQALQRLGSQQAGQALFGKETPLLRQAGERLTAQGTSEESLLGHVIAHAADPIAHQSRHAAHQGPGQAWRAAGCMQERQQRVPARERAVKVKTGQNLGHSLRRLKRGSGMRRMMVMMQRQMPGK